MEKFIIKSGIILMLAAGIIIVSSFLIFAIASLILLAPGFLLYSAGIKNLYKNMTSTANGYADNKMIDITPGNSKQDITDKGKALIKTSIRKIRNFLNKYAD